MIRTGFAYLVAVTATLFHGTVVFVAAALRRRGRIYFWATRNWAGALLWGSGCGVRVHGLERVDWSRPAVLIANHVSSFEILAIAVTVPVPYHFVAKKELERIPFFGPAWKAAGHISLDRANRQKAIESLRSAAEMLRREGGVVVIFPEGTRSPSGEIQPFKRGAFLLALEARVPIIPVVVTGSERITRPGRPWITPGVMDLHVGEALSTEAFDPESVDELLGLAHETMAGMLAAARIRHAQAVGRG